MTPFNMFLLLMVIVAAALGFRSGIIKQVGSLAAIIIGVIACRMFGPQAEAWALSIAAEDTSPMLLTVLAYVGVFIIAYFAVILIVGVAKKIVHGLSLGWADRISGAVFKVVLWSFVLSIFLNVWKEFVPEQRPEGVWAQRVEALAPAVMGIKQTDNSEC